LPESDSAVAKEVQRAILLHAESLVLDDLRKLWSHPMEQGVAVPRDSAVDADGTPAVVLIAGDRTQMDAAMAAASHTLDPGRAGAVAAGWPSIVRDVPPSWNCRDRVERGGASLLWFRAPRSRPWISRDHPLAHLWVTTLIEAVQASVVSVDLVRTEVRLGRVRPSLLEQVERGNPESLLVSRAARRLDAAFASEGVRSGPPALRLRLLLRASARQARRRVRAYYRRLANSR
jgi:hypothetical protein